jgi:hypothetical protein
MDIIFQSNQPGFVNDAPYYNSNRPRRAHVKLPCAALERRATEVWKAEGDPRGFKADWRKQIADFLAARPHIESLNLYDHEGNILETFTQPKGES